MLEAEAGAAAEQELSELCKRTGLPDGDELKWSPPSTAWMRKGLVGDDRQAFFEDVACILASHHATAIAVMEDNGRGTATEAADAEHDVVELLFERITMMLGGLHRRLQRAGHDGRWQDEATDRWSGTRMAGARLTRDERSRVEAGIAAGETNGEVAGAIGRHRSTVGREIRAGGGRARYRATDAQAGATQRAKRPRERLLAGSGELAGLVAGKLAQRWSPHAIVAWLRANHGLGVCAETIYQACYQGVGLFAGAWRHLVCGRARRRPRARAETAKRNVLGDIVNLSARPAAAADRTEAGHWEGDLVKGAMNRSGVVTLVERVLPGRRADRRLRRRGHPRRAEGPLRTGATAPAPVAHLGPRPRDGHLAEGPRRRRPARVLLRPPLAVAAANQREHQPPSTPLAPEGHRPLCSHSNRSGPDRF